MAHHDILLLLSIKNGRLSKDIWQLVDRVNSLADATVYKIQVVTLLVDLDYLVAVRYLFLEEVELRVLDDRSRQHAQLGHVGQQKVHLLLALRDLCVHQDVPVLLAIKLNNNTLVRADASEVSAFIAWCKVLPMAEVATLINCLRELEVGLADINFFIVLQVSVLYYEKLHLTFQNEEETVCIVASLVQEVATLSFMQLSGQHQL